MTFTQWFQKHSKDHFDHEQTKIGWEACKVEMLNVLHQNIYQTRHDPHGETDGFTDYAIKLDVLEEIKKL